MSDSNELKPNTPPGTPVPDLIEQYRVQRDAWIAQADELARLRDEVRGSAEREAMEIVTNARRDVRQIVMEARRELLVLSAQVQAALGEAGARPDPGALLKGASDTDGGVEKADFTEAIFAPQEAVKGMLDEARADMDALVEDARTVPFQALTEPTKLPPLPEPPNLFSEDTPRKSPHPLSSSAAMLSHAPSRTAQLQTITATAPTHTMTPSQSHVMSPPPSMSPTSANTTSAAASRMLLSSQFPSDAVPVPSGRRARAFVALFAVVGIAVFVGTYMWLRSDKPQASSDIASRSTPAGAPSTSAGASTPAASAPVPAPTPAPMPSPVANTSTTPSALSLVVEARRSSWLRTTVDGESDSGRMLAQGETVRLNAKQSVSLRVGDAGAVFVSVNNGQPAPLGRDGQVVTRQFVVQANDRQTAPATASAPPASAPPITPTVPQSAAIQKPAPVSPIAVAPPSAPPPSTPPPTAAASNPVPLVQPVAATPTRQPVAVPPSGPPIEPPPPARAEATVPPSAPPGATPSPASAVVTASRQWLDAYHRQDRATLATLQTERLQLTDERRNEERFPSTVNVNRTLDRVSVQIAADTAVLTAVMTERSSDNAMPPRVSPISQVWELRGSQWRVSQVRLVSEARLNQIFR